MSQIRYSTKRYTRPYLPDGAEVDAGAPHAGNVGEDEPEAVRAVAAALRRLQKGRHRLFIEESGSGLFMHVKVFGENFVDLLSF